MVNRALLSLTLLLGLQACYLFASEATNVPVSVPKGIRPMEMLDNHQTLGPSDRITYRVIEDQDEPRSLLITDSGDLDVPYLGLVHAAGKTPQALAKEISAALEKTLYYKATVIISAEAINRKRVVGKVYVTGQVRNTGGIELPADETLTVSRAILNAGGFSDFSDRRDVRLIRNTPNGKETHSVNVQEIWEKGALEKDLVVQPGDLIVVPERLVKW